MTGTILTAAFGGTDIVDDQIPHASDWVATFDEIGRRVQNTSTGHDHDGTDSKLLYYGYLLGIAQNAFQIVQATTFVNQDNLFADIFSDSNGKNNTVASSTAIYDAGNKCFVCASVADTPSSDTTSDPDGFTNPSNAFDNNAATFATKSVAIGSDVSIGLGKVFSSKYIVKTYWKVSMTQASAGDFFVKLQGYNGSVWSDLATIGHEGSNGTYTYDNLSTGLTVNAQLQGIRIAMEIFGSGTRTGTLNPYELRYDTVQTSTITSTTLVPILGTEKGLVVYTRSTALNGSNISVDVKDGTNTLSNQPINQIIDISSLIAGNLSLVFNLNVVNKNGPVLYGYGGQLI
jgi:hypothetical protein